MFLKTAVETETEGEEQRVQMRGAPQGGILGHTLYNVDDLKDRIKYPFGGYVKGTYYTGTFCHIACEYVLLIQTKKFNSFTGSLYLSNK